MGVAYDLPTDAGDDPAVAQEAMTGVDANDPNTWRWIWLVAALGFALGELAVAGSFFLAPFAIGAAVAAVLAFAGVDVNVEWLVFMGISAATFLGLRPIMKRLDADGPAIGIGSSRQLGQRARVVEAIDGEHDHGTVLLGAERWRAESVGGDAIEVGATVTVVEVRGTRVLVARADLADPPPAAPTAP